MTTWLFAALLASLAGNAALWRLWRGAERNAASEGRRAVLEAYAETQSTALDKADEQSTVNAADRGGASDVLARLRATEK